MYHSGNDDLVVDEPEIQSIRKPRDHGPPCVAVNLLKGQRQLTNSFDGRIDRISETLTKLGVPCLEPALCLEHFALSGRPKDYLIDISLVEEGRDGEVRHYGKIAGISRRGPRSSRHSVRRHADCDLCTKREGEECAVANPSSMPKRSGDRIKTDRRDGNALARWHRAGALTAIYIPAANDEALRDLFRAREAPRCRPYAASRLSRA